MKKSWYLNLSGFCLTLYVSPSTIPYYERAFFGLLESMVLVNGTQKFASLDFREVCRGRFIKYIAKKNIWNNFKILLT